MQFAGSTPAHSDHFWLTFDAPENNRICIIIDITTVRCSQWRHIDDDDDDDGGGADADDDDDDDDDDGDDDVIEVDDGDADNVRPWNLSIATLLQKQTNCGFQSA